MTLLLDLREIIETPGGKVTFDFEPDLSALVGVSITKIKQGIKAKGTVENKAGIITFTCKLSGSLVCTCARCLSEFDYPLDKTITAGITERGIGEDPDGYPLKGNSIDAGEIVKTELIMDLDEVLLCSPKCKGLCPKCGADLNKSKCECKKETDPRLAVLEQLLD